MANCSNTPVVMTVAGSDSGGGAGIQADLKVFYALKVFGTSAVTCITAQNPARVAGVLPIDQRMVALQIKTVLSAFRVNALKTGMLFSPEIIRAVANIIRKEDIKKIVVDPVMIATSGGQLMERKSYNVLCSHLLPLASIITPNIPEAEVLSGRKIRSVDDMKIASRLLCRKFGVACVVKGGHLKHVSERHSRFVIDIFCEEDDLMEMKTNRVRVSTTHGTGCRFSAATTALLARGFPLRVAVHKAQKFVAASLANSLYLGR